MWLSECCQTWVDTDIMICSCCTEHLGDEDIYDDEEETCPNCNGTGEADEVVKESFASQRISPRYEKVKCERCTGEG